MEQKSYRLYPTAPPEKIDLEQRLEKKLNDVNSFNNSINNIKEMTSDFTDNNNKSKRKYEKYKMTTIMLKSFDTFLIIATTSSSTMLSLTAIGLVAIPISTATACGLSIRNKVFYEIIINYNRRDQQTIESFDILYRKSLQGNLIDKNEYEGLCNFFY